jgi:dipeptidyl aminopeptidase/acylaminoacyl peptidase
MKKSFTLLSVLAFSFTVSAQQVLSPEALIQLGKVTALGLSKDGKSVIYQVKNYNISAAKSATKFYTVPVSGAAPQAIESIDGLLPDSRISPDGKYTISAMDVKIDKVSGPDHHPDLPKSEVMIYDDLNYRHWDTWEDGAFSHVFLSAAGSKDRKDLMPNEPFDCPQKPFGGDEDFIFSPDSKKVLYVTKKKAGKDYALSTNTDIFSYDIASGQTVNLTEGMMGYDMSPAYSSTGILAFLSMKTDGYESDKNDIVVLQGTDRINLTKDWDGTVDAFRWSNDGKKIFFTAATDGTVQVFSIDYMPNAKKAVEPKKLSNGDFDIRSIVGQSGNLLIVERTDMNHAQEVYSLDIATGAMKQLSHANDDFYKNISLSKVERRYVTAADGQKMLVWVVYPPNFDPNKKYPTLLYCQGGPQSPLTQTYSFRWNFQLMAANGYIVVAPNRRGMPGHGVKWNEQISRDYGGMNMKDYLISIDEVSKEAYVDKSRLGAVGASYGGYSVFYLAGIHEKRFKSFIAHDGIFDWRSMYGTTEELFFVNQDLGGAYWDKDNAAAQKSYNEFNPVNHVKKWDTPIMIIQGEKDFRVPVEQGLGAFQAAQLQGIKSRLLYFPSENHWILKEQDGVLWHREFYKWLGETLK